MQKLALAILAAAGLMSSACGPRSSGVTGPTPVGQTQPPAVNVQAMGSASSNIRWDGDISFDQQTGTNRMALELRQTGPQISGSFLMYGPDGGAGPLSGTVSGNTFSFNFSIGNQGQGCGSEGTTTGTATVGTSTMTGTFTGKRCNGQPYNNGRFTANLPPGFRTSPFPVAGSWTTTVPPALGGGRWTWNISETIVDLNSSNVSGSGAVTGGSLNLGSGSLTGPVTNTFPGPTTIVRYTVTFAGSCASSFSGNVGFPGGNPAIDGRQMTGGIGGTTCNGSVPQGTGMNLFKQ